VRTRCVVVVLVVLWVVLYAKPYQKLRLRLEILQAIFFSFSALLIVFVTRWTWTMIECLFRNPNWWSGMRFLSSIIGFKRLRSSFSKSFDMLVRSDIGLYEEARSGGLLGLTTYITCDFFHCSGTHYNFSMSFFSSSLSRRRLISSKPGTLFWLMLLSITWETSKGVECRIFSFVSSSGWH